MKRTLAVIGLLLFAGVAMGLDSPLSELKDTTVACSPTAATKIAASSTVRAEAMYISNKSATCVRVGGSGITASTGAEIGDGCHDGPGISVDAKVAYCFSESGSVTVDVLYGVR